MNRKSKGKRKNLNLYRVRVAFKCVLALFIVTMVGVIVSAALLFKVEKIETIGGGIYNEHQIISGAAINPGENLLLLDIPGIEHRIETSMPYIEKATVSRGIPNKVIINVSESSKAGFIRVEQDKYIAVGSSGKVLEETDRPAENLPVVEGVEVPGYVIGHKASLPNDSADQFLWHLFSLISQKGYTGITRIDLSSLMNVSLTYQNRIVIALGVYDDEIDFKLTTAYGILKDKLFGDERGVLNLSTITHDSKSYFIPD